MFATLSALLLASLPRMFIAAVTGILSKLVSEKFLQKFLEQIIISALRRVAPLTTNSLDDKLVTMIEERLTTPDATPGEPVK